MSEDEKDTTNENSGTQDNDGGSMKDVDTAPPFVVPTRSSNTTSTLLVDPKINTAPVITEFARAIPGQSEQGHFITLRGMRGKVVTGHLHLERNHFSKGPES